MCAFFVALLPVWVVLARRSPATREVLYSGWEPVIIAMAISRYAQAVGAYPHPLNPATDSRLSLKRGSMAQTLEMPSIGCQSHVLQLQMT